MNKIVFLLCLCSYALFGQEYHFDFVTRYVHEKDKLPFGPVIYTHGTHTHYILQVFYNRNDELKVIIYDEATKVRHHFSVELQKNGSSEELAFHYEDSRKLPQSSPYSKHEFEFMETPIDSSRTQVLITTYQNNKRKRPFRTYHLEVIPFATNRFNHFKNTLHHVYESNPNFNPKKNWLVVAFHTVNAEGITFRMVLAEYQKVNITIKIDSLKWEM